MQLCHHCQSENSDLAKFCKKCGQSLVVITCPHCHKENDIDSKFCQECGKDLFGDTVSSTMQNITQGHLEEEPQITPQKNESTNQFETPDQKMSLKHSDTTLNISWIDMQAHFRKLEIYMDGTLIAKAKWFKQNIINVHPGKHILIAKQAIYQSPPLEILCNPGETIKFITGQMQSTPHGTFIRKMVGANTWFLDVYSGPPDKHPMPIYDASDLS